MTNASETPETERKAKWTIRLARGAGWLALGLAVAGLVHLWFIRPWYLTWGATGDEIGRTWPGDELAPRPVSLATRALTINAPLTDVWPWIVQIGQDRGGCYSYTWLENLFFVDMHNADRIHPEWQARQAGDTVWLARKDRYGGRGRVVVALLEPHRAMVLVSPSDAERISRGGRAQSGTWTFILDPINHHATRLILRSRGAQDESFAAMLFGRLVFDPVHFVMERKMMLGIKQRAENAGRAGNAALSPQLSAFSHQLSAFSHQLSAFSRQLSAIREDNQRPVVRAPITSSDSMSQWLNPVAGGGLRASPSADSHLNLKTIPALGTIL